MKRGQPIRNSGLSEFLDCKAKQGSAAQSSAMQSKARQGKARQGKAVKRVKLIMVGLAGFIVIRGESEMSMREMSIRFNGVNPLLMHNPQTVDRSNPFARRMSQIHAKKARRTDEDFRELADLEIESGVYFNDDMKVFVPTRWVMSAYAKNSHAIARVAKGLVRGTVFVTENAVPLDYKNKEKVKAISDIVKNPFFRHKMILPQKQVRVAKTFPIFHDWSFACVMEYDDSIIDPDSMERIIQYAAKYGGFGDFRPTFGRATAKVDHG